MSSAGTTTPEPPPVSLRRLVSLARPQRVPLAIGTVFLLLGGGMGLVYPKAIGRLIDHALSPGSRPGALDEVALFLVGVFAIQSLAAGLRIYLFAVAGHNIVARLRERLYRSVVAQEIAFFDERRTGELVSRLGSDTSTLQSTVTTNVSMALRHVVMILGGVTMLVFTSAKLALWILAVVPPLALGAVFLGRRLRKISREAQDALARAGTVAEETLSGIRTVRAFVREPYEAERYGAAVWDSFRLSRRLTRWMATFAGGTYFAAYAALALVLWRGGTEVLAERMSVGDLMSFLLYTMGVAISVSSLAELWADFQRAAGASSRVFELLDRTPRMPPCGGLRPERIEGRVEFQGVGFTYPARPDTPVLHDVDLTIEPGRVVALVGPSGSGKSTLANLIPRFYDPDAGRVLVDGRDVRELDPAWLRAHVGTVAQEPLLFSATIAENLRYADREAGDERLVEACRAANAHEFISAFPNGYASEVGERGVQLSVGQKQRLAIARAVLKDPKLLILDEATSSLDSESEALVQEALDKLMAGRTTVVIAHRLSTVRHADRVVVLADGRIEESGTHDELMAADGLYRRLVERQIVVS